MFLTPSADSLPQLICFPAFYLFMFLWLFGGKVSSGKGCLIVFSHFKAHFHLCKAHLLLLCLPIGGCLYLFTPFILIPHTFPPKPHKQITAEGRAVHLTLFLNFSRSAFQHPPVSPVLRPVHGLHRCVAAPGMCAHCSLQVPSLGRTSRLTWSSATTICFAFHI